VLLKKGQFQRVWHYRIIIGKILQSKTAYLDGSFVWLWNIISYFEKENELQISGQMIGPKRDEKLTYL